MPGDLPDRRYPLLYTVASPCLQEIEHRNKNNGGNLHTQYDQVTPKILIAAYLAVIITNETMSIWDNKASPARLFLGYCFAVSIPTAPEGII